MGGLVLIEELATEVRVAAAALARGTRRARGRPVTPEEVERLTRWVQWVRTQEAGLELALAGLADLVYEDDPQGLQTSGPGPSVLALAPSGGPLVVRGAGRGPLS